MMSSSQFSHGRDMQIDKSTAEEIYTHAYYLFQSGNFLHARHLFGILTVFFPQETRYILGVAGCLHLEKEFQMAAEIYEIAAKTDLSDPLPYYHQTDCEINLGHWDNAKKCLIEVIKRGEDKAEFGEIVEKAKLTLAKLVHDHPIH